MHEDELDEWPDIICEAAKVLITYVRNREEIDADQPFERDAVLEIRRSSDNHQQWIISLRENPIEWYKDQRIYNRNCKIDAKNYIDRITKESKRDGPKRPNRSKTSEGLSKLYTCGQLLPAGESPCDFFLSKDYSIMETDQYGVDARPSGIRLLTISPREHVNNETWMKFIRIFQVRRIDVEIRSNVFFR